MEDQVADPPLDAALSTEEILVAKNSMPEDDPNGNTLHDAHEIRWGPQHAGAKLLASQYTQGKHTESRGETRFVKEQELQMNGNEKSV